MGNETDNPKQVMSLELEESDPTTASAAGRVPRVSFDAASIAGNPARIDDPAILPGARSAPTVSVTPRRGVTTTTKISTKNDFDGDAAKFPVWRLKQLAIFRAIKVDSVLRGEPPIPSDPHYPEWSDLNTQLHDHLILNLDASSLLLVRDCSEVADGRAAWERLCKHYDGNTGISKQGLLNKLFHLQMVKGEAPHDFAMRIKQIADQLAFNHKAPQAEENLIAMLLTRLTSEYSIIATILSRQLDKGHICSLADVVQALRDDYETRQMSKSFGVARHNDTQAHAAFGTAPNTPSPNKFKGRCHTCNKVGHKSADCYHNRRKGNGGSGGSNSSSGSGSTTPPSDRPACSFHKVNSHSDAECKVQRARRQQGIAGAANNNNTQQSGGQSFAQQAGGESPEPRVHFSCAAIVCGEAIPHATALSATPSMQGKLWIHVDSCASNHILDPSICMINGISTIYDLKRLEQPESIKVGGGYTYATHTGSTRITIQTADKQRGVMYITNALIVKGFGSLLLSLVKLENEHNAYVTRSGYKRTLCFGGGQFTLSTRYNIYSISAELMHVPRTSQQHAQIASHADTAADTSTTDVMAMVARAAPLNADVWHARMGHANMRQVEQAASIPDNGVVIKQKVYTGRCEVCPLGKSHQQPHPIPPTPSRADEPAAMVMMDVFGPLPEPSLGGARFAVAIVDSHTRMVFLYTLAQHTAEDILDIWQKFITRQVIPLGRHVRRLRTDNAKEFGSKLFMDYNWRAGITQEFSSPYTPQQLGMVEAVWKPLTAFMRMTLSETKLPASLWAEMLHTKVHIRNRLPYMTNPEQHSPYRMWFGKEPNLSYLRIIGSAAFVHEERGGSKLLPRAWQGRLVGYNHDSHLHDSLSYRVFNPADNKVYASRNVTIIEPLMPSHSTTPDPAPAADDDSSDDEVVTDNTEDEDTDEGAPAGDAQRISVPLDSSTASSHLPAQQPGADVTIEGVNPYSPQSVTQASLSPSDSSQQQSGHDESAGFEQSVTVASTPPVASQRSNERNHKSDSKQKPGARSRYNLRSNKVNTHDGLAAFTHAHASITDTPDHTPDNHTRTGLVHMAFTASLADDTYAYTAERAVAPSDATLPFTHEEAMNTNERDLWLAAEQAEIASLQAFDVFT